MGEKSFKKSFFWRRQYFINPEFQGSFIQMVIGAALLINLVLYGANIFIFFKFNAYGESLNYDQKKQFYEFFQNQILALNQVFVLCGGIVFGILIVYGLLMSHKVAGPLHNLQNQLKKLQKLDDLQNIHNIHGTNFRKTDYFQELAEEYNKALVQIQQLQWNEMKDKNLTNESVSEEFENNVEPLRKVS